MHSLSPRSRRRSAWIDPRMLIGVLIVIVSVCGVWAVIAAARQTAPVLVAARTLVIGEPIEATDVRVVEIGLGDLASGYAVPGALEKGAVAVRTVPTGELVPVDAVGTSADVRTTTVVVPSALAVPATVTPGSAVEVWVADPDAESGVTMPRILIADATVVRVVEETALVSGGATSLELVVPRADVADLLAALAGESLLSVVPGAVR